MCPHNLVEICQMLIQKRSAHTDLKFNHMCMIMTKKGVPLSYGFNDYDIKTDTSIHAEAMALKKLLQKKSILGINKKIVGYLIVVRTNGNNSKPCNKCLEEIEKYSHIISLKNIYYTHEDEDSGIRKSSFKELQEEPQHICSYERYLQKIKVK
jgi:cytidine deaminase